jgi:hypothetical protein
MIESRVQADEKNVTLPLEMSGDPRVSTGEIFEPLIVGGKTSTGSTRILSILHAYSINPHPSTE